MDSSTHKQSAALTTGHGTLNKMSSTFKQDTAVSRRGAAPSNRSQQSQEEERLLQTGHGTPMQATALSTEVRAPLNSTGKARYSYTQVTLPTGLQQQGNTLKPNCNKMLD
jgi:hypothetical protein